MVQFLPTPEYDSAGGRIDSYNPRQDFWKLLNPLDYYLVYIQEWFRRRDIELPRDASDSRIDQIFIRAQCGLLIYDNCTSEELARFCETRHLAGDPETVREHSREDLIAALEQADEKFAGFSDLPPEIRVRIYEWYKASLPVGTRFGEFDCVPPITQVNRLIRRETLTLFVHEVLVICDDHKFFRRGFSMEPTSEDFWKGVPESWLRCVKRLNVMSPLGKENRGFAEWRVDLERGTEFVELGSCGLWLQGKEREDLVRKAEIVEGKLKDFEEKVQGREPKAFQRGDAARICGILERALYSNRD